MATSIDSSSDKKYSPEVAQELLLAVVKKKDLSEKTKLKRIDTFCKFIDMKDPTKSYEILNNAVRYENSKSIFLRLFEKGVIVAANNNKSSPLHYAAFFGRIDLIELFLLKGIDIDALDEKKDTPLHWAVRTSQVNAVKTLLQHNANVNILDNNGKNLTFLARNNPDIIALLNEKSEVKIPQTLVDSKGNEQIKKTPPLRKMRSSREVFPLQVSENSQEKKPVADPKMVVLENSSIQKDPPDNNKCIDAPPIQTKLDTKEIELATKTMSLEDASTDDQKPSKFEYLSNANWY